MNIDTTLLIFHHVAKSGANLLESSSSRGASAFIDGCRWAANVKIMDQDAGIKFDLDNHRAYLELLVTKSNYTCLPSEPLRFRHVSGGGLVQVDLSQKRLVSIASQIRDVLEANPHKSVSQNEIYKLKAGDFVRDHVREHNKKISRNDIKKAISYGLQSNLFYELEIPAGTKSRKIICVQKH